MRAAWCGAVYEGAVNGGGAVPVQAMCRGCPAPGFCPEGEAEPAPVLSSPPRAAPFSA